MSKLPPLPTVLIRDDTVHGEEYLTLKQVREYGQLCRDQAIDEVARFINGGSFLHDKSPEKLFANQLVQKILELK